MEKNEGTKKEKTKDTEKGEPKRGRGRKTRAYPLGQFQDAHDFAKFIHEFGSGQKVRRLAAFDKLGKSPDSSLSRTLVTNSNKYGLIKGNYASEFLELTSSAMTAFNDELSERDRQAAKIKLVINDIAVFKFLYERLKSNKLPNQQVIADIIKEEFKDIEPEDVSTVVDLFIVNTQYLKLLRVISGAERLLTIEHCLEEFDKEGSQKGKTTQITEIISSLGANPTDKSVTENLEQVCFYITPIGEENSTERKHSDLFLGSIVEPALDSLNLRVIRADKIDKPGTINKQIIEYLSKAKLVIADLSFNNPNVFYELAIRHAFRLPTVQIIRKGDKIPFDVSNSRTIVIDTTDIYSLVPKLETHRSEIASQVRQVLHDPDSIDNPLTIVYPNIKLKI